jgi:hypothetical protein
VLNDGLKQARDLDAARIALSNAALDVEMDGWSMNMDTAIQYALDTLAYS